MPSYIPLTRMRRDVVLDFSRPVTPPFISTEGRIEELLAALRAVLNTVYEGVRR